MNAPHRADQSSFARIILDCHRAVDCSTPSVQKHFGCVYLEAILMMHPACLARNLGSILCIRYIGYNWRMYEKVVPL